jgi:hypothetical protein
MQLDADIIILDCMRSTIRLLVAAMLEIDCDCLLEFPCMVVVGLMSILCDIPSEQFVKIC